MADVCLFVSWSRPIPGREKVATETFGQYLNYLGGLQKEGRIENFEPVLLAPSGSSVNGFCLIRGEYQKLAEVRGTEAWREWMARASVHVSDLSVNEGFVGEGINRAMQRYQKVSAGL